MPYWLASSTNTQHLSFMGTFQDSSLVNENDRCHQQIKSLPVNNWKYANNG